MTGSTELRYWDSSRAYTGYTLFSASGKTYLIDMEGYVVNQWNIGTNPRLLDNGNLLDATKSDPSGFGGFRELDWGGNTIWEYTERRTTYFPHHDWTRIFNRKLNASTTLYEGESAVRHEAKPGRVKGGQDASSVFVPPPGDHGISLSRLL
jgi:hypothetical protein